MILRRLSFFFSFILIVNLAPAQENFRMQPEHPKAGDAITFSYEPAGDLAGNLKPVEMTVYINTEKERRVVEIKPERKGKTFVGSLQTEAADVLLNFVFSIDEKFDTKNNEGYLVMLTDDEGKVQPTAWFQQAQFYQYYSTAFGVDKDDKKALACMEKELELHPEKSKAVLPYYASLKAREFEDQAPQIYQDAIERFLAAGLENELDYIYLEFFYRSARLPEQLKLISSLQRERYPNGLGAYSELLTTFNKTEDIAEKQKLLSQLETMLGTEDALKDRLRDTATLRTGMAGQFAALGQWEEMKNYIAAASIPASSLAAFYNKQAGSLAEKKQQLEQAVEMAGAAVAYARREWKDPQAEKPASYTSKQWAKTRAYTYATYADTYAKLMYQLGKYKEGITYAREAALDLQEGKSGELNTTYALLASKVQPVKKYKAQLEQFVKDYKATPEIKNILKELYVKKNKSDAGFSEYITALEKESYLKMIAELRKSMLNETGPTFALLDLDGNKVNVEDLKGKVVVVDFWATWCGPCKMSFPAMQKMVTRFKDNPDVKFIFIDTWETTETKAKNAGEFIAKNKYSFHVLMDNDNEVIQQFKVEGIPTKFVLDKNGRIRFRSVGFDGNDENLIKELTAMIELAGQDAKAF